MCNVEHPISQTWAKYACMSSDTSLQPSDEAIVTLVGNGEYWALKRVRLYELQSWDSEPRDCDSRTYSLQSGPHRHALDAEDQQPRGR